MPAADPLYLQIALDSPVRRLFDYLPPDGLSRTPPPGVRVEVPFGRRTLIGVLVGCATRSDVPADRLKRARRILDDEPLFDAASLELLRFAADYYQAPLGEAIGAALPVRLRQGRSLYAGSRTGRRPAVSGCASVRYST